MTASSRRRKETSWLARPGLVGEDGRICDILTGRPVSVERIRRCRKDLWPVNRSGGCVVVDIDRKVRQFRGACVLRDKNRPNAVTALVFGYVLRDSGIGSAP